MKLNLKEPAREFRVGKNGEICIRDMGEIGLAPNEMITMVTDGGKGMDVSRKEWGFYATPSINARLKQEGFKTALVKNTIGRVFVMVVDIDRMDAFRDYCANEEQTVLQWLDEL